MNTPLKGSEYPTKAWIGLPVLALCLSLLSACSTTRKVAINQADLNCAFLANDCSLLTPGGEGQNALRWLNPAAQSTPHTTDHDRSGDFLGWKHHIDFRPLISRCW